MYIYPRHTQRSHHHHTCVSQNLSLYSPYPGKTTWAALARFGIIDTPRNKSIYIYIKKMNFMTNTSKPVRSSPRRNLHKDGSYAACILGAKTLELALPSHIRSKGKPPPDSRSQTNVPCQKGLRWYMSLQVSTWYFCIALSCISSWRRHLITWIRKSVTTFRFPSAPHAWESVATVRVQDEIKQVLVSPCHALDIARFKCWDLLLNFKVYRKSNFVPQGIGIRQTSLSMSLGTPQL